MPKRKSDTNKENEDPNIKLRKKTSEKVEIDENNNKDVEKNTSNEQITEQQEESVNIENEFAKLNKCLRKAKQSGDYSIDGVAHELPCTLGLEVDGFGPVSLPLVDPQASKLIERCEQAPYGKDFKTLVDKNVRDSFQLEPSQFKIRNPNWEAKLNELIVRVGKGLGCQQTIEAKLYKLLVYKEGGHFLKHRDTEKEDGMFGTLIIQPPSIHQGGELIVYENNGRSKKEIDFGEKNGTSEFAVHFAAHFADLEHEILEMKSGYRLAIIYSLCWPPQETGSVISNGKLTDNVFDILQKVNSTPYALGLILEHQYTVQSLRSNGVRAFKGLDNDRFNLIHQANRRLPEEEQLAFHICHARLVVSSYDGNEYRGRYGAGFFGFIYNPHGEDDDDPDSDSYDWIEDERKMGLAEWYDADGNRVFDKPKVELSFFDGLYEPGSKKDTHVDLKNDKEWGKFIDRNFEAYSGNAGATMTTEYSKYILVIWPKRFEYEAILKLDLDASLNRLFNAVCGENTTTTPTTTPTKATMSTTVTPTTTTPTTITSKTNDNNDQEPRHQLDEEKEKKFARLLGYFKANRTKMTPKHTVRILRIITKINKLEYAKMFFEEIDGSYASPLIPDLVNVIDHFGFDALIESLRHFSNISVESFTRNCFIVELMHVRKEHEMARKYFQAFILPFLEDANNLENLIKWAKKNPTGLLESDNQADLLRAEELKRKQHIIVVLLKTLKLFESEQTANIFETLKEKLSRHMRENNGLRGLITEILREKTLNDCRPVVELYEERKQWLLSILQVQPAFSWEMPQARFPDYPIVENFLKSHEFQHVYKFQHIAALRSCAATMSRNNLNKGFSVYVTVLANKRLNITKTKEWFESNLEELNKPYTNELQQINIFLNNRN